MNSRWSADSSNERDDRRQAAGRRGNRGEPGVVEAHGDLGREILELIAGEAEFWKDDQIGTLGTDLRDDLEVPGEVLVERAKPGRQLGERDPAGVHEASIPEPSVDPGSPAEPGPPESGTRG